MPVRLAVFYHIDICGIIIRSFCPNVTMHIVIYMYLYTVYYKGQLKHKNEL